MMINLKFKGFAIDITPVKESGSLKSKGIYSYSYEITHKRIAGTIFKNEGFSSVQKAKCDAEKYLLSFLKPAL